MNFDTNAKILAGLVVSGAIAYFFIAQSTAPILPETSKTTKTPQVAEKKKEDNLKILYLESDKKETSNNTQSKQHLTTQTSNEVSIADIYDDKEKIEQYIEDKGLVNITKPKEGQPAPRFQIYADISQRKAREERDDTLPPSAPAIVTYTFSSGTQATAIIDHDVYTKAKVLVAVDTSPDGSKNEIAQIPQQQSLDTSTASQEEAKIIAPPSIGQ